MPGRDWPSGTDRAPGDTAQRDIMFENFGGAERDAIGEIVNIAVGRAAALLSDLVGTALGLTIPSVAIIAPEDSLARLDPEAETVAVRQCFGGALNGEIMLVLPELRSLDLVRSMLARDNPLGQLTELEQEGLIEIGNIVLNACLASLADKLGLPVESTLPVYLRGRTAHAVVPGGPRPDGEEEPVLHFDIAFTLSDKVIGGCIVCAMDRASVATFGRAVRAFAGGG